MNNTELEARYATHDDLHLYYELWGKNYEGMEVLRGYLSLDPYMVEQFDHARLEEVKIAFPNGNWAEGT